MFLDALGSSDWARGERRQEYLERLFAALARARVFKKGQDGLAVYEVATFTDNLVVGCPVSRNQPDAEGELGLAFILASIYQFQLAIDGVFIRGGVTRGEIYMDDDFTYGPGLVEAYELEQRVAAQPRIVLSQSVVTLCIEHTAYYGDASNSPHDTYLLVSQDGEVFLNYLSVLYEEVTDVHAELHNHKNAVEAALTQFSGQARIWSKYCWVADYHNYFCSTNHPDWADLLIAGDATSHLFRSFNEIAREPRRPAASAD